MIAVEDRGEHRQAAGATPQRLKPAIRVTGVTVPIAKQEQHRPSIHRGLEGPAMLKIVVLGCVLAAIAVTLKIRLETPEGRQPLARALVTIHLQQMRDQEALP